MHKSAILAGRALIGSELKETKDVCIIVCDGVVEKILTQTEFDRMEEKPPVIDLRDMTVLPGLIECHNHLALDARLEGHLSMMELSECEQTLLALNGLKDDLMSGVTTARCLGDRYYIDVVLKKKIAAGEVEGPDLLVSGIGMRAIHGHGVVGLPHSGVEDFRRTCRENMYRGCDILKIFVSPGAPARFQGDFVPCYPAKEEIQTVVAEARSLGLRTAAHCIGGIGLDWCVECGIDCIEHVYSITQEQVRLVEEEYGGWLDLTSGIVLDPEREPFVPEGTAQRMRDSRAHSEECLSRVYESGKIRYAIGTDANHGLLYKELEIAVAHGADTLSALKAVTVNAAEMCGLEKTKGQIAQGMQADLIAVSGNPTENVGVLSDVRFVMKKGKIYKGGNCNEQNH